MPTRHNCDGTRLSLRRIGLRVGVSTRAKFLVLSNGLRDQLGHYFETSISVAEAAERAGFQAVLGTHVECSALLPDSLTSHALFRTDYWMWDGPAVSQQPQTSRRNALKIGGRALRLAERGAFFLLPHRLLLSPSGCIACESCSCGCRLAPRAAATSLRPRRRVGGTSIAMAGTAACARRASCAIEGRRGDAPAAAGRTGAGAGTCAGLLPGSAAISVGHVGRSKRPRAVTNGACPRSPGGASGG